MKTTTKPERDPRDEKAEQIVKLMFEVSKLSDSVQQTHTFAYYALNRAWRELETAHRCFRRG